MAYVSTPFDELEGLRDALVLATLAVPLIAVSSVPREVTVLNRMYDDAYTGTYPLILLPSFEWHLDRLRGGGGGVTGRKGQDPDRPSLYTVEIHDVVDLRVDGGTRVADAQTDIINLIGAIGAYFDHAPHRCLPDQEGVARASVAGDHIRFKGGTFRSADGREVRVIAVGQISVVGQVHPGSLT